MNAEDVDGYLGLILGAAIGALMRAGRDETEIREMIDVALRAQKLADGSGEVRAAAAAMADLARSVIEQDDAPAGSGQEEIQRGRAQRGGSLNPTPDCGYVPRQPPGATEVWWCEAHREFHGPDGDAR